MSINTEHEYDIPEELRNNPPLTKEFLLREKENYRNRVYNHPRNLIKTTKENGETSHRCTAGLQLPYAPTTLSSSSRATFNSTLRFLNKSYEVMPK